MTSDSVRARLRRRRLSLHAGTPGSAPRCARHAHSGSRQPGRFAAWDGPCASAGTGACYLADRRCPDRDAAAFGHSVAAAPGPQPLTVTPDSTPRVVCHQPSRRGSIVRPTCTASFASGTSSPCTGTSVCGSPRVGRGARSLRDRRRRADAGRRRPPAPPPDPERPPEALVQVTVRGPGSSPRVTGGFAAAGRARPSFGAVSGSRATPRRSCVCGRRHGPALALPAGAERAEGRSRSANCSRSPDVSSRRST